ncbi:MAG: hypothetical protein NWF00_07870 [Candidatus Bathyarchaeota archaeon]|nr:hypothetical protein [Candidatus Bathyarchaeota archaeon]
MKRKALLTALLLAVLAVTLSATAYADTTYSVYIMDPNNSANGAKGVSSSGYWVGQIPIRITSGTQTFQTTSYCMEHGKVVHIGSTYTASLTPATDTATWRAVSYILSWHEPTDDTTAAVDQVAIWKLIDPSYTRDSWLDINIYNTGIALAASANGHDMVRQDDQFNWLSPITSNGASIQGSPGQTVVFTAQLTNSGGTPRPNVKVQFTVTLNNEGSSIPLGAPYVTPAEDFTDSQGRVHVSVTVPEDTPLGSTIQVQACTRSVWSQRYVDLTNPDNQDLIAMGEPFGLTMSTNICILGYITVVPESALGALSALAAFAAAFIIWKRTHHTKHAIAKP